MSDGLTVLCRTEDVVEGEPIAINKEGFPPLAVYKLQDSYYVTSNICTHGNALMTDGYQEGHEIECPFHGGVFDLRTGEALEFPCQVPLQSYPVTLDGGQICIRSIPPSEEVANG